MLKNKLPLYNALLPTEKKIITQRQKFSVVATE